MRTVVHDGQVKLLVRTHAGQHELFNPSTDKSEFLPASTPLGSTTPCPPKPILPSMVPLGLRPPGWLRSLRDCRREVALAGPSKRKGDGSQSFDAKVGVPSTPRASRARVKKGKAPTEKMMQQLLKLSPLERQGLAAELGLTLTVEQLQ